MSDIRKRKKDHVDLTLTDGTQYSIKTGFENYYFLHDALPELNIHEISTDALLLGQTFDFPLFISSMTGGYADAAPVNSMIAEFCEQNNLPFGVGSQRAMLEDSSLTHTFSIVRSKAPNAFICGNIGGVQLIDNVQESMVRKLIDSIEANALIVHLNPLQELMQPEGDRNFRGVLDGIERLISFSEVPVIVKETGAGISQYTAKRLLNVGVSVIDVAGAGGTSWAKVENFRDSAVHPLHEFDDWGIPTAICLQQINALQWERSFDLIASGGIRSASDMAKALCFGATFTASAQPIIKSLKNDGLEALQRYYDELKTSFIYILALLGCSSIQELRASHLLKK